MQPGWIPQVFTTTEMGVSTAYSPELIPDNQLVWLKNGVIRGGKPHPRPGFYEQLVLPSGPIQGASYFSVQNGMIVAQIGGRIYRIRINNTTFAWEAIPLDWLNSGTLPYAWMQETVGYLVIQDGQSNPIIYNGSTARRADPLKNEVPKGKMMAYGNGRLWVAIDDNDIVAGDIKTNVSGSELLFTETQYFTGGGAFYFPFVINGMGFIPASGASGYGSLLILGKDQTHGVRADISSRDQWATFPGFIQPILLNTGACSHFSLAEVNQDLYWRDGEGGVRSIRSAASDEINGPGNVPISREIARITDFESENRLDGVSAIHFDNRLIMTASPFIDKYGHTAYRNLFSLDFSPISSNSNKSPPAYDGQWQGLYFKHLIKGLFRGKRRAFALVTDDTGVNRLWEFNEDDGGDSYTNCFFAKRAFPMVLEYPARNWGDPKRRKRIERCDVYLANIRANVHVDVYWRADNFQKWTLWDSTADICSLQTDGATNVPHVFKNLAAQERSQVMTFTPPDGLNPISNRGLNVGFMHQVRVVVTGDAQVYKVVGYASMLDEEQYADRDNAFGDCIQEDITGNEINYQVTDQVEVSWVAAVGAGKWDHAPNDPSPDAGYNPGLSGNHLLLWVINPTDGSRVLLRDFTPEELVSSGSAIDFTAAFNDPAIRAIPGTDRLIFATTTVDNATAEYPMSLGYASIACSGGLAQFDIPWYAGFPLFLAYPPAGYGDMTGVSSGYDPTQQYTSLIPAKGLIIPDYKSTGGLIVSQQAKPYVAPSNPDINIRVIGESVGCVSSPTGINVTVVGGSPQDFSPFADGTTVTITFSYGLNNSGGAPTANGSTAGFVTVHPQDPLGGGEIISYTWTLSGDMAFILHSVPNDS